MLHRDPKNDNRAADTDSSPALVRQVGGIKRRTRRAGVIALGLATLGGAIALGHVTAAPSLTIRPVVTTVETTVVESVSVCEHAAAPTPIEPPPAPRPVGEPLVDDGSTGPLVGVATSRRATDVIAVWSERAVAISRDGGEHFVTTRGTTVNSVAVDADGTVHVIRVAADKKTLRLQSLAAGSSRDRAVPFSSALSLTAAAGHLIVHNLDGDDFDEPALLWISSDGGETWRQRTAPSGNFANELRVSDDGSLQLFVGFEAGCGGGGQSRYLSTLDSKTWERLDWGLDIPIGAVLGDDGWTYGIDAGCNEAGDGLCAIDKRGATKRILALRPYSSFRLSATNGRASLATSDDNLLVRLRAGRVMRLPNAPAKTTALAMDRGGRALAISGGYLVRLDGDDGWRSLFPSRASVALASK